MRLTDLISETLHSLTSNKVRSGLTILGIVVGIASVIAMLGIGAGAQKSIEDSVQAAGSNVLTIMPSSPGEGGGFRGDASSVQSLTTEDAAALAKLPLLSGVAPNAQGNGQLVTKNANANASLIGATPAYQSVKGLSVKWGSFISDRNDTTSAQVVVLGSTLAEDLFGVGVDPTGQRIR
ncbi:MAG: ABC transporter permease, partial [Actinomycetia bacterium]|nr:ABC transporter permease [Actinomycetes bacterium]